MDFSDRSWSELAGCRGVDPSIFYPERGETSGAAIAFCHSCPVEKECLEYALEYEPYGIWGGKSERERKKMKSARSSVSVALRPSSEQGRRRAGSAYQTCVNGHDKAEFWYINPAGGGYCKECHRQRSQQWRNKRRTTLTG